MHRLYIAIGLALIVGCAETPTEAPSVVDGPSIQLAEPSILAPANQAGLEAAARKEVVGEPIQGQMADPVEIGLVAEVVPPHRDLKRMDIDQLRISIQAATGGEGWVVDGDDQFEELARTLGKPDYFNLTSEDLEPAALFQKFLDDAARSVCYELAEKELEVAPESRVLMVHASPEDTYAASPEKIEANLSLLLKRYHGRHAEMGDPALKSFLWLYQSAEHVSQDPVKAWRTVCVGLIVHPAFYTY